MVGRTLMRRETAIRKWLSRERARRGVRNDTYLEQALCLATSKEYVLTLQACNMHYLLPEKASRAKGCIH